MLFIEPDQNLPKRVDNNHGKIRELFRARGASVLDLSRQGKGCPDLAIGYLSQTILVEVKSGPNAKLTKDQEAFFDTWKGAAAVCRDAHDVDTILQRIICDQIEGVDDFD